MLEKITYINHLNELSLIHILLYESHNSCDCTSAVMKYEAIVDGVDVFDEEDDSRKVILIHSKQKTQLRKDSNFISADKYEAGVMVSGAIGRIAGCDEMCIRDRCKGNTYYKSQHRRKKP